MNCYKNRRWQMGVPAIAKVSRNSIGVEKRQITYPFLFAIQQFKKGLTARSLFREIEAYYNNRTLTTRRDIASILTLGEETLTETVYIKRLNLLLRLPNIPDTLLGDGVNLLTKD